MVDDDDDDINRGEIIIVPADATAAVEVVLYEGEEQGVMESMVTVSLTMIVEDEGLFLSCRLFIVFKVLVGVTSF